MTWQALLTLAVVAGVAVGMARDRLGADLVMFSGLVVLVVTGVVAPADAFSGFANPALVTIAALFIVAAALQETGALTVVMTAIFGKTRGGRRALLRLLVPAALSSGFMNNTPIVAMFIPVVREYAKRLGQSPSRFLMPLSFAAILGGTSTLIGTSGNLVVSGMLTANDAHPLSMFEISWVGIPSLVVGLVYLIAVGPYLLPRRRDLGQVVAQDADQYLAEVRLAEDSPLVGRTVEGAQLRHLPGLFLVEIRRRDGDIVRPVTPESSLEKGDHLVFTGIASTVADLRAFPGLVPLDAPHFKADEQELVQVVVSHRSDMVGRTVRDANFRRRFGAAILAVQRAGERIESKIGDIILRPGDTLMLLSPPGFSRVYQTNPNFYLVSELPAEAPPRYRMAHLSLAVLGVMALLPAVTSVPMPVSAAGAVVVLLLSGAVSPRRARAAVNWPVLVVIGSALGIAQGMATSGAAELVSEALLGLTTPLGPLGTLGAVYLVAVLFASVVSNAAAAALVFPVAWGAAEAGGLDPRPLAIAVAMASSAVFSTPMSYAHLLIWGPGGYRYGDFARLGLPLNVLLFLVAMGLIPLIWPLVP